MNSPLNASDRKSIRAAEKASAQADRARGEVLINLMSTAPGRRFIWDKLGSAHIFQTSFSTDPVQMAFYEGERNQGLLLLNDIIQWCPDTFIQAMRESNERRDTGQRHRSEGRDGDDSGPTGDHAIDRDDPEDGDNERG